VIGTFVLGLGDSLQQAPQAQLDASSTSSGNLTISHNGGDALTVSDVSVSLNSTTDLSLSDNSTFSGDEFGVGDSATFESGTNGAPTMNGEVEVTIIHKPSQSILLDTTVEVE
jgi:FlaG/FlaF family flagellin (archaellin)